jgi:hypothetical protein
MKITSSNISINVKDLDKSISFYESIGLTVKNRWGNYYAQLTAPDVVIGLHPSSDANLSGNSGNALIGFTVDDFEGAKSYYKNYLLKLLIGWKRVGSFFILPTLKELLFILLNQTGRKIDAIF